MHIELISKSTVKIIISASELDSYGLNYDMIQTESTETRTLISDILSQLLLIKNIDLSKEKLYIEAFSDKSGGCLMYISGARGGNLTDSETEPYTENHTEIIYFCRSIAELVNTARDIKIRLGRNVRASSLYCSDEDFCLIISISNDYLLKAIKRSRDINTVGNLIRAAHIREHCTPILEQNAVERLSQLILS